MYIDDIRTLVVIPSKILFANDAKCYKSAYTQFTYLTFISSSYVDFGFTNQLQSYHPLIFKAAKCNLIRFKPIFGAFEVGPCCNSIDGCEVSKKDFHHDLCIKLSASMSWHYHFEFMVSKAYKTQGRSNQYNRHNISLTTFLCQIIMQIFTSRVVSTALLIIGGTCYMCSYST